MGEETQQALWNFDGAEAFAIFEIKKAFINSMQEWDLENSFWHVRSLRREIDAKLKRAHKKAIIELEERKEKESGKKKEKKKTEKQIVDEKLEALETARKNYNEACPEPTEAQKSKFYKELEEFYMHLCYLMKKHGMYFREGEDMTLAVLRR